MKLCNKVVKWTDIVHMILAVICGLLLSVGLNLFVLASKLAVLFGVLLIDVGLIIMACFIFYETTESDSNASKIHDIFLDFMFTFLVSLAVFLPMMTIILRFGILV